MRHTLRAALLPSLLLGVSLAACAHTEPDPGSPPDNPPFGDGSWPRTLTFSTFDDRHPQWLPDGSGIVYSTERGDQQRDRDRCIALIRPEVGTQIWRRCELDGRHVDTTDVWEWPSVGPDGRTIFIHTTGWNQAKKLGFPRISLAHGWKFEDAGRVRTLPFTSTSGLPQTLGWTFRWASPTRVIYLGVYEFYQGSTFFPDTFFTGQEVMDLQLAGDSLLSLTVVPGTTYASSVALADDSTTIYYTIGGDSLVYRRNLTTGVVDTAHNFGFGRVARDVTVRGTTMAAIVGDSTIWSFEDAHQQWVQRDEGGGIVVVDLTDGSEVEFSLSPLTLFRHPELSPDGRRLVLEAQPFAYPQREVGADYNALNHRADLWLFSLEDWPLAP
jgi:hypothetical protein